VESLSASEAARKDDKHHFCINGKATAKNNLGIIFLRLSDHKWNHQKNFFCSMHGCFARTFVRWRFVKKTGFFHAAGGKAADGSRAGFASLIR
jgi:hypothetical protein